VNGRVFPSLKDAIFATASASRLPMKALASELDWSPSELSHRIAQGGESVRPFPADDDHFVKLMRVTGDHSPLWTLCDLLGYDPPQPKQARLGEMITELRADAQRLGLRIEQLVLNLGPEEKRKAGR
jgi:hypothetical protein